MTLWAFSLLGLAASGLQDHQLQLQSTQRLVYGSSFLHFSSPLNSTHRCRRRRSQRGHPSTNHPPPIAYVLSASLSHHQHSLVFGLADMNGSLCAVIYFTWDKGAADIERGWMNSSNPWCQLPDIDVAFLCIHSVHVGQSFGENLDGDTSSTLPPLLSPLLFAADPTLQQDPIKVIPAGHNGKVS